MAADSHTLGNALGEQLAALPKAYRIVDGNLTLPILNGKFHVYAWTRENLWLYIGVSTNVAKRLLSHNVIGLVESLLEGDTILLWAVDDWTQGTALETKLIIEHNPKYNKAEIKLRNIIRKDNDKFGFCANPPCNQPFKPVRKWQKFCSVKCRNENYWSDKQRVTISNVSTEQQTN